MENKALLHRLPLLRVQPGHALSSDSVAHVVEASERQFVIVACQNRFAVRVQLFCDRPDSRPLGLANLRERKRVEALGFDGRAVLQG